MESCSLLGFGQKMTIAAEHTRTLKKRKFYKMRHSGTTVLDDNTYRRSDNYKDSVKRKRLDDSRLPEEEMELDDNDHQGEAKGDTNTPDVGLNGSVDEENELAGSHFEQELGSQTMEVSIQHIRQKMDLFTQQVSGLLEAGKSFFIDAATAFEERIVQLHRNQIEKWEHEIELLRAMDAVNEDMSFRLADARATINKVHKEAAVRAPPCEVGLNRRYVL